MFLNFAKTYKNIYFLYNICHGDTLGYSFEFSIDIHPSKLYVYMSSEMYFIIVQQIISQISGSSMTMFEECNALRIYDQECLKQPGYEMHQWVTCYSSWTLKSILKKKKKKNVNCLNGSDEGMLSSWRSVGTYNRV